MVELVMAVDSLIIAKLLINRYIVIKFKIILMLKQIKTMSTLEILLNAFNQPLMMGQTIFLNKIKDVIKLNVHLICNRLLLL